MESMWTGVGRGGIWHTFSDLGGKFTFRVLQIKIHHENDHSPPGFRTSLQGLKNKLTKLGRCDSYGKSENVTHSLTDSSTGGKLQGDAHKPVQVINWLLCVYLYIYSVDVLNTGGE